MKKRKTSSNSVQGLVSIIIPVYNSEKYLDRCIKSVINQSYSNIEVILVDDGSTDKSSKMCDIYARIDKRIRVIHKKNSGPAAARNRGIDASKGEFIFFVDSDDFIERDSLSLLIEKYNKYKADIIIGDFNKINGSISASGHECFFSKSKLLRKKDILDYIAFYLKKPNSFPLFTQSWGRIFKSSVIKENNIYFNTDLRTFEDVAFNFVYLKYTNKIFFLKKSLYNYQINENYASATMRMCDDPKILFGYMYALANASEFLEPYCSRDDIKRKVGHAYVCYTIIQLVRTCGQINTYNWKKIYKFISLLVADSSLRDYLRFYSPSKGESKILPFLIRFKLVLLIMLICKYKADRRYKNKRCGAR